MQILPVTLKKHLVILVDDDEGYLEIWKQGLELLDYEVWTASTEEEAIACAKAQDREAVLILDVYLGESFGPEVLQRMLANTRYPLACTYVSGEPTIKNAVLDAGGAHAFYDKTNLRLEDMSSYVKAGLGVMKLGVEATRDFTGLYNKRSFYQLGVQLCALAVREQRKTMKAASIGCVVIDVDYFKTFNEKYGLLAGDEVIEWLAIFIKEHAYGRRATDIVAHFGGDEIVVLVPDITKERLSVLVDHLEDEVALQSIVLKQGETIRISISTGAAVLSSEELQTPPGINTEEHYYTQLRLLFNVCDVELKRSKYAKRRVLGDKNLLEGRIIEKAKINETDA